jgi:hypothetical protein
MSAPPFEMPAGNLGFLGWSQHLAGGECCGGVGVEVLVGSGAAGVGGLSGLVVRERIGANRTTAKRMLVAAGGVRPTGCYGSTFRRAPTSTCSPRASWTPSLTNSATNPANGSTTRPRMRSSDPSCCDDRLNPPVLQRAEAPATSHLLRMLAKLGGVYAASPDPVPRAHRLSGSGGCSAIA